MDGGSAHGDSRVMRRDGGGVVSAGVEEYVERGDGQMQESASSCRWQADSRIHRRRSSSSAAAIARIVPSHVVLTSSAAQDPAHSTRSCGDRNDRHYLDISMRFRAWLCGSNTRYNILRRRTALLTTEEARSNSVIILHRRLLHSLAALRGNTCRMCTRTPPYTDNLLCCLVLRVAHVRTALGTVQRPSRICSPVMHAA